MKFNLDLHLNKIPYFISLIIFIIYIARVLLFYYGSDENLIGIIPDDAFYYIQLAKNRVAYGFWTFDGTTSATGFHLLYGYFLTFIYLFFPTISWKELYLLVGGFSSIFLGLAALFCSKTVAKIYGDKLSPLIAIPFLSLPVLLQSTSMMESWIVVLLSSLTFYLIALENKYQNTTLLTILLFTVGLLGSLARTDFGMLVGMIFIVTFAVTRFKTNQILTRGIYIFLGTSCGAVISVVHNYLISGTLSQASAQIKFYWSTVDGHSAFPVISMLTNILIPVSLGKLGFILFWIVAIATFLLLSLRIINGISNNKCNVKVIIFFSSTLTIFGYILFYSHNSTALQNWYSANLVVPSAFCITSTYYYLLRNKFFSCIVFVTLFFTLIAINRIKVIPYPHQYGMLQAGLFLKNQSKSYNFGSWNAGIISYFSEKPLINLDGLTNDEILPYIKSNQLFEYLRINKISYLLDYEDMINSYTLRRRGGYNDIKFDRCIFKKTEAENYPIKWGKGSINLYQVNLNCD